MHPASHAAPMGSPPCVLLTHEYAPFRGGVATYVQEIALAAARLNLPVEVWTVDYRGRTTEVAPRHDRFVGGGAGGSVGVERAADARRFVGIGVGDMAAARAVARTAGDPVERRGADGVLSYLALLGAVDAGQATCFFHGSEILRFRRNAVWRWLARRFYKRAGGFAVNSFHVEQLLRASGLLPEGAVIRVAPCACPSSFLHTHRPRADLPPTDSNAC